ncbi:hypothetical protein D3C76_1778310 [compost metagenome]
MLHLRILEHSGRDLVYRFDVTVDKPEILFAELDIGIRDMPFQYLSSPVIAIGIQHEQRDDDHEK